MQARRRAVRKKRSKVSAWHYVSIEEQIGDDEAGAVAAARDFAELAGTVQSNPSESHTSPPGCAVYGSETQRACLCRPHRYQPGAGGI